MPKTPGLRESRRTRLMSQEDLALSAGVTPGTIVRLEAGSDGYYGTIRKLAAALGVKPQELMALSD